MSDHAPIGYAYDADIHCPNCAEQRFGRCAEHGQLACCVVDSEGNEPGAIAPWSEGPEDGSGEYCGDCNYEIREPEDVIPDCEDW
jgi:hypothetical protein